MRDDLSGYHGPSQPPVAVNASAPAAIFDRYPRNSEIEVLGALRFLIEVEGIPASTIEARAGLDRGAVDALVSGEDEPSNDVVRRLCGAVGMSRWLFFLVGSIKYGADLGSPELQWLIEERRRVVAENRDEPLAELVAEAARIFFKLDGSWA